MTPQEELERIVDLGGLQNVMALLAIICSDKADRLIRHDAHTAKEWLKYSSAIDSAIVKMWGRL